MKTPEKVPEPGFYYNWKHDPSGLVNNHAYEVLGVGFHTENDDHRVVYRPLYKSPVYKAVGKIAFDLKILEEWMGNAEKDGKPIPRFTKITDPSALKQLEDIKRLMYL